jgi:hypothetical protein
MTSWCCHFAPVRPHDSHTVYRTYLLQVSFACTRCARRASVTGTNLFDPSKYTRWVTLVVSSTSKLPYSLHELQMQMGGSGRSADALRAVV